MRSSESTQTDDATRPDGIGRSSGSGAVRSLLSPVLRLWTGSSSIQGIVALLRLLPRVSRRKPALLAVGVAISAALPVATTVLTGLLIGSIPATIRAGLDSPSGRTTLWLLTGVGGLIVVARVVAPLLRALIVTLGQKTDRYLQERVIAAVGRPSGIAPERFAQAARGGAGRGAVTLLVSHRFSTVRMADLIVVLSKGRVLEQGSHAELMEYGGLYAELYDLQSKVYR